MVRLQFHEGPTTSYNKQWRKQVELFDERTSTGTAIELTFELPKRLAEPGKLSVVLKTQNSHSRTLFHNLNLGERERENRRH